MKRYFIVFYKAYKKGAYDITGQINIIAENCFLNRKSTTEEIVKYTKGIESPYVVLTGFEEVSENDYNDWKEE